ncbi:MAG: DUF1552 domain-containing protein [Myxococcales bacterium]|nr:DUF1552 domain-containing protein [Myxococcales bacterium]
MNRRSQSSRRRFLRGMGGVAMALPFLESLAPRKSAKAADGDAPTFAIFIRQGNGFAQETFDGEPERFWPSFGPGTALTTANLSADSDRAISELAAHAGKLTIVRGVNFAFPGNGCGHSGGGNQVLTAARVSENPSGNLSLSEGESIDNRIVRELGQAGDEPLTLYAGRKLGYLDEVLSYRGAHDLRGAEQNPYNVYQDLFGLSMVDPEELEAIRQRRKSVNDLVRTDMQALLSRTDLSKFDRDRLQLHFDSIRDLENGIICGLGDGEVANLEQMQANVDNDDYIEDVMKLHFDVLALAMACGARRSATLQIGCGNDQTQYWVDGVKQKTFHKISHRIDSDGDMGDPIPDADILHHKIDRKLLGLFKYLLDKLASYPMPSGSLLDCGVAVYTNDLSNKWHSYDDVPYILAGSCGGALKTGLYVDAGGVANNKVLSTIGAAVGCKNGGGDPLDDFGDSSLPTGRIDSIVSPGF